MDQPFLQEFNFDVRQIDWTAYLENYCLGVKKFVLKEDTKNLLKARKALQRLADIFIVFIFVFFANIFIIFSVITAILLFFLLLLFIKHYYCFFYY